MKGPVRMCVVAGNLSEVVVVLSISAGVACDVETEALLVMVADCDTANGIGPACVHSEGSPVVLAMALMSEIH